ncbi:MAG: hypothetical protein ACRDT6_16135 [Micromonosporaceae bacterium]
MARRGKVSGWALVAREWPLDGPYSAEQTAEATRAIEELVRYLAYATRAETTLPHPVDLYDLLSGLAVALHSLGQVCGQVAVAAEAHAELDGLALDELHPVQDGEDATVVAGRAADALRGAGVAACDVASHLSLAHAAVGRLRVEYAGGDR